MPDNQKPSGGKDLKDLENRISAVRKTTGLMKEEEQGADNTSAFGAAYRISIEIVVALALCTFIGWGLDQLFDWTPWAMLGGLFFGAAAGINNAAKMAMRMDREALDALQNGSQAEASETRRKAGEPSEINEGPSGR